MNALVKLIQQVIHRELDDQGTTGKVISVDKVNCTCVINTSGDDDADREPDTPDVQLRSIIDGTDTGIIIFPKVGTVVAVQMLFNDKGVLYVTGFSEIESIQVKIGSFKYLLNENGMVFNDGANGGLVNVASLVERLNALESRMATHQHTVASFGISTPDPATNSPLPQTTRGNLEDTKIKH